MLGKRIKPFTLLIIISLISLTTIAFAAITNNLKIFGTGSLIGTHVPNVYISSVHHRSAGGYASYGNYAITNPNQYGNTGTTLTISSATFQETGDYILIHFDITNDGNEDAIVVGVTEDFVYAGTGSSASYDEDVIENGLTYDFCMPDGTPLSSTSNVLPANSAWEGCYLFVEYTGTDLPWNPVSVSASFTISFGNGSLIIATSRPFITPTTGIVLPTKVPAITPAPTSIIIATKAPAATLTPSPIPIYTFAPAWIKNFASD